MSRPLKILMLEDSDTDAEIVRRVLDKSHLTFEFFIASNEIEFKNHLAGFTPDIILADNSLPQFSGSEALRLLRRTKPDIPFILVTGTVSDEFAAGIIKDGADDYILKDRLIRLPSAIEAALKQHKTDKDNREATENLIYSEEKNRMILNTLPAHIALLDVEGTIIDVNDSWKQFADKNGYRGNNYCIGTNYLEISNTASGNERKEGLQVASGIFSVLKNEAREFVFEYSCHSPESQRWYRMVATTLREKNHSGAVVMHVDISELRLLEQQRLEEKIDEQKEQARIMLQAQERERNQLGRELHDNISQLLAVVKMKLEFAKAHYEKGIPIIGECLNHIQSTIRETRNLSHRMVMPEFEVNSFQYMLQLLAADYTNEDRMVDLQISGLDEQTISVDIKQALYRIVQEQLTNIEKYAYASKVAIHLSMGKRCISMVIADNGQGFDMSKKAGGIGLTNIHHRVKSHDGTVEITSEPKNGCSIHVRIPFDV